METTNKAKRPNAEGMKIYKCPRGNTSHWSQASVTPKLPSERPFRKSTVQNAHPANSLQLKLQKHPKMPLLTALKVPLLTFVSRLSLQKGTPRSSHSQTNQQGTLTQRELFHAPPAGSTTALLQRNPMGFHHGCSCKSDMSECEMRTFAYSKPSQ